MKFASPTVLALALTSSVASATHVLITAKCSGVDFVKIPVMQDVFVGNILESSFNKVHSDQNDDIRLSGVNFGLHQDDSSELGFYYGWNGSYGCYGCPSNDDDDFFDDDVAAMVSGDMVGGRLQELWESELANQLVASKHPEFESVGKCHIHMEPDLDAKEGVVESSSSGSDMHVTLETQCDGVDFQKVPLSQNIYIGNMLQNTFNEVHGDERLSKVKFGLTQTATHLGTFFGWNGDYGCVDCQRDDTLHGHWEKAFTEALSTSGHTDLTKANKCTISLKAPMSGSDVAEEIPAVEADKVFVHIVATCGGVDFEQLPISQDEFAGHALESSFNTVHFDDDASLADITYGRSTAHTLGFYYGWNGSYGCYGCPSNDDDDFFDDDVALTSGELKGKHHGEWEKEFETILKESKHKQFAHINNCKIHMTVNEAGNVEENTSHEETAAAVTATSLSTDVDSAAVHVFITAYCDGFNFAHLSLADDEFAGHALEDAFNTVHGTSDKRLSHVHYGKNQLASGLEFYYGWNGSYGCYGCPSNDDDDFFDDDVSFSTAESNSLTSHTAEWQTEFGHILSRSGRTAFKKMGDCKIHMSADLGAEERPTVLAGSKCGLRTCAES